MNTPLVEPPFVRIINRSREIDEATQRLERMLADLTVLDCVLFYYGVSSVGKTTVLGEIRREADRRGVPTALVDFDREQTAGGRLIDDIYDGPDGQVRVAKRLMKELGRSVDFVPSHPIDSSLSPDEAADRLLDFAYSLYRFSQQRPFALFFDTIEDSDRNTFLWTQEKILEPLLSQFKLLVVMASRTRPNTTERNLIYPIERRTQTIHLRPFDRQETNNQLAALGAKDLKLRGADLIRYTSGLPGLNDEAARWLAQERPVDQLLSHLVDKVIFKRLAHRVPSDLQAELLAVSVFRQFDSGLLRRLVRTLWPDKYTATGIAHIRELLKRLQQTRLVEPHPDGYGYVVPRDLRLVLDRYYQETQPDNHFHVHKIAAQWFLEQLEKGDHVAVADRLYHLGGLWRDLDAHPYLADELDLDLRPKPTAADRLVNELQGTLDELRRSPRAFDLVNKIKNVLGEPEFKEIFKPDFVKELIDRCEIFNQELS